MVGTVGPRQAWVADTRVLRGCSSGPAWLWSISATRRGLHGSKGSALPSVHG